MSPAKAKTSASASESEASSNITKRIESLDDWRGETLARMRKLIHDADPDVVETWKWMGTPIWEHDGIICTGESYKKTIKLTFAKGASLPDPKALFNSSLDGNVRRAIDIAEGEQVDAAAFKALVKAAVALNSSKAKPTKKVSAKSAVKKTTAAPAKKAAAKKTVSKAAKKSVTKSTKTLAKKKTS